jgi:hypothetical protein
MRFSTSIWVYMIARYWFVLWHLWTSLLHGYILSNSITTMSPWQASMQLMCFFLFSIQAEGPKLLICCLFVKRDHLELWMEGNLLPQLSFTRIHLISAAHVWALYGLLCNQFKACDATWEWCHKGCGLLSVFSRDVWCFCILYFVQYHSSNPSTVVMVFQVLSTFCFQNCVEFLTVNVLGQGFI